MSAAPWSTAGIPSLSVATESALTITVPEDERATARPNWAPRGSLGGG